MVRTLVVLTAALFVPAASLGQSSRGAKGLPESKAVVKPGGPPAVSVECQPMGDGQFQLKIRFYPDATAKLKQVSYNGELGDIERQVQSQAKNKQLPDRVAELVQVALKRLRAIQSPQPK